MRPFQVKDRDGNVRYNDAWLIKFRTPDGTYRKQVGGRTEREAEKALQKILGRIEAGTWIDPRAAKRAAKECRFRTFGDVTKEYSRSFESKCEGTRSSLETVIKYLENGIPKRGTRGECAPLLPATTPIAELTPARLRRVRDAIEALPRALTTRNLLLTYVKMLFKWATKHPEIPLSGNPAADLEGFRSSDSRGAGRRALERDEVFSAEDVAKILETAFAEKNKCHAYLLQTAFATGLRKGELCGLLWGNVDLERRTILVCRNFERRSTKSGRDRAVPLTSDLAKSLRLWKAASPFSTDGDPVFPDADGKIRTEDFEWARLVRRFAKKAGVNRPRMKRHGHGTRHYFATAWLLAGGSDSLLARVMGHRNTDLIHSTYAHFCDDDLVRAIDRISLPVATKQATTSAVAEVGERGSESAPDLAIG